MNTDWKEFFAGELDESQSRNVLLQFGELSEFPISAVSQITSSLFQRTVAAGFPGLAVGVCDYTREALSFAYGGAIVDSLVGRNRKRYATASWVSGDILSFLGFNFEFRGISSNDAFGETIEYTDPNGGKRGRALSFIPGNIHVCPDGVKPTTKRKGNPTFNECISLYKEMSPARRTLYDSISLVEKPVAYVTSRSSFLNIPPTKLRNATAVIDGEPIALDACIKTGYIASDGSVKESCEYQVAGEPAVIVPCRNEEGIGDLYYVLEYIESGNEVEAVVVEAPEIESIEGMFSHLEDIASLGVPIIVFCDEQTLLGTEAFDQLGFAKFVWPKELLADAEESAKRFGFGLTHRERCVAHQLLRVNTVKDEGGYSEIAKVLFSLSEGRSSLTDRGRQALNSLNRLLSTALKQTEVVLEDVSSERIRRLDDAVRILTDEAYDCSLTDDEVSSLERASTLLRRCCAPHVASPKEDVAYECIKHSLSTGKSVCLVTSSPVSANEAMEYWQEVFEDEGLPAQSIRALTPREFLKQNGTADQEDVFISGWFSREMMEKLVLSGLSSVYSILLYKGNDVPLETQWYVSASSRWAAQTERAISAAAKTLKTIGVEPPKPFTSASQNKAKPKALDPDKSISFVVEKMDDERAESERAREGEEAQLARAVYFSDGRHRWLRIPDRSSQLGGDKLVVMDGLYSDGISYIKKTAAALHQGDIVLKMDSDDEALDEMCRATFGSYETTLQVAKAWRQPIDEARTRMSDIAIKEKIKHAGSKKTDQTILSWIRGDIVIAPNKKRDIVAISKAFGDCFSDEEIARIIQAVRIIKGTRINSGKSVTQTIVETFINDVSTFGLNDALTHFSKRHDLGTVELMCVEHVGPVQSVGISRFGYYID